MFDIKERSREKEILDDITLEGNDLEENLRELAIVNQLLGGHRIAIHSLAKLMETDPERTWRIADLGSGGGDTIAAIARERSLSQYCKSLVGIDINARAVEFAKKEYAGIPDINFLQCDLLGQWPQETFDITMFNLVLHHFSNEQIITILKRAASHSRFIVINDLQRNWVPYHLFRITSRALNFSEISRKDGKLSVKKGFTRKDLQGLLKQAGFSEVEIKWRWAFRLVTIIDTENKEIDN